MDSFFSFFAISTCSFMEGVIIMTKSEYENLKVGDLVVFRRGHDEGKIGTVLFKKHEQILVESTDGKKFKSIGCNKPIRLTGFHEIDIF